MVDDLNRKNIKLTISYKGTNYFGWQVQPEQETIQEIIENAFYTIFNSKIQLKGSGRTDAGVHAINQVANFITEIDIEPFNIMQALNTKLPADIKIKKAENVEERFHSRFDSIGKTYMYNIYNSKTPNPFIGEYSYRVSYDLDFNKMEKAAKFFLGEHDFYAFMSKGSSVKDTIRNIYDIKLINTNNLITILITGNGFLYNMVRIIAGTLIEIGRGFKESECIIEILESNNRKLAGHTAKSQGLFLYNVYYEKTELDAFLSQKTLDTIVSIL